MKEESRISDWIIKNHRRYIIINKPSGVAVQRKKDGDIGLQELASAYTKCELHLINRIDQPVSGLVLLAKDAKTASVLSKTMQEGPIEKVYLAIVDKGTYPESGHLTHYLAKQHGKSTISDASDKKSKKAVLSYRTIQTLDNYNVLEVKTETGRFHQIRAQLAAIGANIKGDVKYGSRRGNRDRSIHLHAYSLTYFDPISKSPVIHTASLPDETLWNLISL